MHHFTDFKMKTSFYSGDSSLPTGNWLKFLMFSYPTKVAYVLSFMLR